MKRSVEKVFFLFSSLFLLGNPVHAQVSVKSLILPETDQFHYFKIKDWQKLVAEFQRPSVENAKLPLARSSAQFVGNDTGPMLTRIWESLGERYQQIGQEQVDKIKRSNGYYWDKNPNNIGFGYHQGFTDFYVNFHRQLSPDLHHDKIWIVKDELNIFIDASKFLGELKDREILDISEENIAAFAGIVFKRTYRHTHFAGSYEEGLSDHYEKLFLNFKKFEGSKFLALSDYEILEKEDYLSGSFSGVASGGFYGGVIGIGGAIGLHGKYDALNKIQIYKLGNDDQLNLNKNKLLNINYEKSRSHSVGVSAKLQLDFLRILKMTLLSFDFDYSLEESEKIYLDFDKEDRSMLEEDGEVLREVQQVLKGRYPDIQTLLPFLVSEEIRKKESMSMKYSLLLNGGMREQATEIFKMTKDGNSKTFFRHNFETIKFKQSFWGSVLGSIIKSFLGIDSYVNEVASSFRRVSIEYEGDSDLMKNNYYLLNEDREKLTFSLSAQYFARATTGGKKQEYKNNIIKYLMQFTPVHEETIERIQSDELIGPMKVTANFQMNKASLEYFHRLPEADINIFVEGFCNKASGSKSSCKRKFFDEYDYYMKIVANQNLDRDDYYQCRGYHGPISGRKRYPLSQECKDLVAEMYQVKNMLFPMDKFKELIQFMVVHSNDKQDFYNFFGKENVFSYGQFEAKNTFGFPYLAHFRDGVFTGLGLIDDYQRGIYRKSNAPLEASHDNNILSFTGLAVDEKFSAQSAQAPARVPASVKAY